MPLYVNPVDTYNIFTIIPSSDHTGKPRFKHHQMLPTVTRHEQLASSAKEDIPYSRFTLSEATLPFSGNRSQKSLLNRHRFPPPACPFLIVAQHGFPRNSLTIFDLTLIHQGGRDKYITWCKAHTI